MYQLDTAKCYVNALIVFVHTPAELMSEVIHTMDEYRQVIPDGMYRHIRNRYRRLGSDELKEKLGASDKD